MRLVNSPKWSRSSTSVIKSRPPHQFYQFLSPLNISKLSPSVASARLILMTVQVMKPIMAGVLAPLRRRGQLIHLSSLVRITPANAFQLRRKCTQSTPKAPCSKNEGKALPPSIFSSQFWNSRPIWNRAGVNTLRCLVGCTLGDFSSMWYLQAFHPDLGMTAIMAISSMCPTLFTCNLFAHMIQWPAASLPLYSWRPLFSALAVISLAGS